MVVADSPTAEELVVVLVVLLMVVAEAANKSNTLKKPLQYCRGFFKMSWQTAPFICILRQLCAKSTISR